MRGGCGETLQPFFCAIAACTLHNILVARLDERCYTLVTMEERAMQKTYTVNLTANELGTILELVKHEQQHYADSDDEVDSAVYALCDSIINKIYAAN